MSRRDDFLAAMQEAAAGTPYAVTPTETGFDVGLDVVDAQWYGLINKAGLTKTYVHHVKVDEDGTYSVTDDMRTLNWVAGVPRLAVSGSRTVGRVKEFSFQKTWALDEHGQVAKVVDYTFNSEEGRQLVTTVGAHLGLEQVRGTAEKIGIWFAVVALVGCLITVIVLLVAWQQGAF
jgi:hypothetical protein